MNMHEHIFIPSSKKDIFYCQKCQKLSYKGIIAQSIPIDFNCKLNDDPLSYKYITFSYVANLNSDYQIKYLEHKRFGILQINYLINKFGLKSMIFYKSICLMDQIYLENQIPIDYIKTISSICVLLIVKFNECCMTYNIGDFLNENENNVIYHYYFGNNNKNQNKTNIRGFFHYIKKNINNSIYWETLCLKYVNYNLKKNSAYDYLILFFRLGLIFCKESINIMNKFNICLKILDYVLNDKISCIYSQYILSMSIIKVVFECELLFDKNIFKNIYGVDLSKKKYMDCSNMIKKILKNTIIPNNYLIINNNYTLNNPIYNNFIINYYYTNNIININEFIFYLLEIIKNKKIKEQLNSNNDYDCNCNINEGYNNNNNNYLNFKNPNLQKKTIIINNNIINNNININNYYFYFHNYSKSKNYTINKVVNQ